MGNIDGAMLMGMAAILNAIAAIIGAARAWKR